MKNLRKLFDKYAVALTEHDALVKSMKKIFSNFVAFSENPNFTLRIQKYYELSIYEQNNLQMFCIEYVSRFLTWKIGLYITQV